MALACTLGAWLSGTVESTSLEPDYAQKLASLAERTHVQEGTLARSLLSSALDEADPDASRITEILDGIPGAWERAQESIEQARRGERP